MSSSGLEECCKLVDSVESSFDSFFASVSGEPSDRGFGKSKDSLEDALGKVKKLDQMLDKLKLKHVSEETLPDDGFENGCKALKAKVDEADASRREKEMAIHEALRGWKEDAK